MLRRTNTSNVIWRISSFTGRGRFWMQLRAFEFKFCYNGVLFHNYTLLCKNGVRQGGHLPPFLSSIFLKDLGNFFETSGLPVTEGNKEILKLWRRYN
jgi:hypothetical protein